MQQHSYCNIGSSMHILYHIIQDNKPCDSESENTQVEVTSICLIFKCLNDILCKKCLSFQVTSLIVQTAINGNKQRQHI